MTTTRPKEKVIKAPQPLSNLFEQN
jgi:hypothetical protein